jgi:lysozyme
MTVSPRGRQLIQSFEGCRLRAYQDSGGVWTVGFGHVDGVVEGQEIGQAQADRMFQQDVDRFAAGLNGLIRAPVSQDQFDALCSLAYNIGLGAFAQSTLLKLLNDGNMEAAAQQFMVWIHVAGTVSPGLVRRRAAEAALFTRRDVMPKSIFASKTFWIQVVSVAIYVANQLGFKAIPIDPGTQLILTSLLNIWNRFNTSGPVAILPKKP